MKILSGILAVLFLFLTIGFGIGWGIRDYLYNLRVGQYVKLADDASLPKLKRDYLLKYKSAVEKTITRDSARYIFTQERFTKTAQFANLDSLIKRLDDISALSPDSFAYQQGLEQITGQEFDHTMAEINDIFKDCYMRESFIGRFSVEVFFGFFLLLATICGGCWFVKVLDDI